MPLPNPLGSGISRRLKKSIEKRGFKVSALAEQAGISRQTLHTILNGEGHRSAVKLMQNLAKLLKVPPGWLAFGEGEEPDWT